MLTKDAPPRDASAGRRTALAEMSLREETNN